MIRILILSAAAFAAIGAGAAEADVASARADFAEAFNARDWDAVRTLLSEDVVFHRANAEEVFVGPDAVMARWRETIGAPDQWNVKFRMLDADSAFTGADGRVVERGDFAVTAGLDDEACYRGSFMMTWVPSADQTWHLQLLAWQDVETELANCET